MSQGQENPVKGNHINVAPTIDCVFTWVNDQQSGYLETLAAHSLRPVDRDPSRTRDNIETLRYSLRSIELFAPWIRNIYLFTCRPQVPAWLNVSHPRLKLIHHDEVIPAQYLPTFNSLNIISFLHELPGLSDQFLYLEDDMVLLRKADLADFQNEDGKLKLYEHHLRAPTWDDVVVTDNPKPWNMALAESNTQLDANFGKKSRQQICHMPKLINRAAWRLLTETFPESMEKTRTSKFRAEGNIALEYIYPHMLDGQGQAELMDKETTHRLNGYVPLENFWPITALRLMQTRQKNALWLTMNDNFGAKPSRIAENLTRKFLNEKLGQPSSFERA